jgi:lipopolysaccharide export system protein LptC
MNAAKQAFSLFALLMMLASLGWYFASETPKLGLSAQSLSRTADAIVSNLTLRQFNTQGMLTHYLESQKMEHTPYQDSHFFQMPHIIVRQEGEADWEIYSQKAQSIHKGEQVTFTDQVIVHQAKGEKNEESTLNTEKLVYFPQKKLATSDKTVVFKQQGSVVHSEGMNAYFQDKHIELLGKARAIYNAKNG